MTRPCRPCLLAKPLLGVALLAAASTQVSAAIIYKDVTTTDFNNVAHWSTTSGAATPNPTSIGTTDTLRFNEYFAPTSGTMYTSSLSADITVDALSQFVKNVSEGKPENVGVRAAESTLTSILGQMAIDQKREVTWDEMMRSA